MSLLNALCREAKFTARDRAFTVLLAVSLLLAIVTVVAGLLEVNQQRDTIAELIIADKEDRDDQLAKHHGWGSAAYYGFHLTYDEPSNFAFAALGQRDQLPWKHRIRMLALEGQIYERDVGNPVFALVGRFDFAFFVAFVLPLILILALYDLRASERAAGRHDLLVVTAAASGGGLWLIRAGLRALAIFVTAALPLVLAACLAGSPITTLLAAVAIVFVYTVFWAVIALVFSARPQTSSVILVGLAGVWLMLAVVIPAGGRWIVDSTVQIPTGAEILMTQREAVNDAWDLPKAETMEKFIDRHPEWAAYTEIDTGTSFDWSWYYAFQQVGDQTAEQLSKAYRNGRLQRNAMAQKLSFLAPPALVERAFQSLAHTDVAAAIEYEDSVRTFHAQLCSYFYPRLFKQRPFDEAELGALPKFKGK